jgi:fibronectin-binding autotransporter adhesin
VVGTQVLRTTRTAACNAADTKLRAALLVTTALTVLASPAAAQDAQWGAAPGSGDFNDGANWAGGSVPTGIATFGASNTTALSFAQPITNVDTWMFEVGAPAYSFVNDQGNHFVSFIGDGIVSNGVDVVIDNSNIGYIYFRNTSTAGDTTINNSEDSSVYFLESSTADGATINNSQEGMVTFNGSSTAADSVITNSQHGNLSFLGNSTAGNAAIGSTGASHVEFEESSTAGNATITNTASQLRFRDTSTAGDATITNDGDGFVSFFGDSSASTAAIDNSSFVLFRGTSTAGNATINNHLVGIQTELGFADQSSAGNASITNDRAKVSFLGDSTAEGATIDNIDGSVVFQDSSAGHAMITNTGTGYLGFYGSAAGASSTAEHAVIINSQEGTVTFNGWSTAADATIDNSAGGDLIFWGNSTAGDASIVNGGTGVVSFSSTGLLGDHKVTAGSISGGGSYILDGTELTVGGNNSWAEVSGDISGVGSLVKAGTGLLTLTGTNSYTGGTVVSNGTLQLGTAGDAGAILGVVTVDGAGTLRILNADTTGITGLTNEGFTVFNGSSSAAGLAITNGGTTWFNANSSAADVQITNVAGVVAFFEGGTAANASITSTDRGEVLFYGYSTAGDAVITGTDGIVTFHDNSTAGNATIVSNGQYGVDFSSTSGLLGDGRISAGSIAGTSEYFLDDNELTVGGNNLSTEVGGVIGGTGGSLVKTGTGTLTLSGVNTYTGATLVDNGMLVVNGDISSSSGLTLGNGGSLGGGGIVSSITVASGGVLAPGNSIGTLNVTGDVGFDAGSFFDVEVDHLGNADLLAATGTATIDGGTVRVLAAPGAYAASTPYTILSANLVTGTFDDVTSNLAFLTPTLSYDLQSVILTLDRNDIDFVEAAATGNQRAAADAAQALGAGNTVHDAILDLSESEARAAFDALSGEAHATIKGLLVENSGIVRDALLGRLQTLRSAPKTSGAAIGYASEPLLPGENAYVGQLWGQLYGGLGSRNGDGNAAASEFGGGGLLVGADAEIDEWRFGFSVQAGASSFSVSDRASTGTSTDIGLGVYGGTLWGDTGFGFGASFTRHAIATTREVAFPGFAETLTASYGATTGQAFAEIDHEFDLGDVSLTPFAQLAYAGTATEAFTEDGGAAALSSSASVIDGAFAALGLRAEHQFLIDGDGLASLSGGLAWRHGSIAAPVASNAFAGGGTFTAFGSPAGSDALVLEAAFSLDLANGLDLSMDYAGQIATEGQSHALSASIAGQF